MKKIVIALILILSLILLIVGSAYTVYKYNASQINNSTKKIIKDNASLEKNFNSSNNISTDNKNPNNISANEIIKENVKIKATDFKLKDLSGKEVSLSDYKGKKIFLNFWASWCPPCKAEMPEMEKLYQETKDSDLVILAVNIGEDKDTVQKFIKNNNYNFPVLLDIDNAAAIKYQIVSIPTSFFIDKEGNIVGKHIGSMTIDDMKSYINNIK